MSEMAFGALLLCTNLVVRTRLGLAYLGTRAGTLRPPGCDGASGAFLFMSLRVPLDQNWMSGLQVQWQGSKGVADLLPPHFPLTSRSKRDG